jgi:tRNA A-37 threonylcarbamoyl transferase component Bud32/ActR/RegA family two-component response regulator
MKLQEARSGEPAAHGRTLPKLLVVHDDPQLRVKLAALVGRASREINAATSSMRDYESMSAAALRDYAAVLLLCEVRDQDCVDQALAWVARLRRLAPRMVIFVVASGGNERIAVRFMQSGANDYWPARSLEVPELALALRSLVLCAPPADSRQQAASVQRGAPLVPGYRLVRTLSQSAGADVYLAECIETESTVALKVQLIKNMPKDVVKRFLRECELLSRLNHRAVADVIGFGATTECVFIALEYYPCGSLRDRLKNPLSEGEAVEYAKQIATALGVIHQAGIVHRDIKPSNCMLTGDNRLVLIDFGLARIRRRPSDITEPGLRLGSPHYISPEQIDGAVPDVRSDLYSLGVVFFEMLNGSLPFQGKDLREILEAHMNADLPRLTERLRIYQPVLNRMLAKSPADRFTSTTQFQAALDAICHAKALPTEAVKTETVES